MSCERSAPALRVELSPSPVLLAGLGAAHGLAGAALVLTRLGDLAVAAGALALAASLLCGWLRHGPGRRAVRALVCNAGGGWTLLMGGGEAVPARLCSSFVHPRLLVLRFRLGRGRWRTVVLPSDAAPAADLRRLRVRLRWQADGGA